MSGVRRFFNSCIVMSDTGSLGLNKFMDLAKDANATYKLDKVVLVNCDLVEEYLEGFRIIDNG